MSYEVVCMKRFRSKKENAVFLDEWGVTPIRELRSGKRFRKFLQNKNHWDVIHFHLPSAQGPLWRQPKSFKSRTLVTVHTTAQGHRNYVCQRGPLKNLYHKDKLFKMGYVGLASYIERKSLDNAAYLIAVSFGIKNEIAYWHKRKDVTAVNSGIDVSKLKPPQPTSRDTAKVLFVGRLVPQKGIFLGIEALSRLELDHCLLVVGTGPDRGRLEKYRKEKGVDARFFGFVEDSRFYNLYANSDILFMPSLYEGLPIVEIEGAGSGLPVVAVEEARIQQVVCEENWELIAHTGEIDELSNALDKLIEDKNLRRAIGRKNRENVPGSFTEERMVDKYVDIYEQIIRR